MKANSFIKIGVFASLAFLLALCSVLYFAETRTSQAQDKTGDESMQSSDGARVNDDDDCGDAGTIRLPATKLIIEHNATAADTGVHGFFDGTDWTELEILDPRGRPIFEFEPKRQFRTQSISGVFFESAEPPNDEVPISEILRRFPEGRYPVRGCTPDGERLTGSALFTHDIPEAPVITFPLDGNTVPASNLTVMWNHVTTTLEGDPLNRTGYELILTKDVADDPNGFSKPTLSIHLPPSVTSCSVPNQFLQPGSRYEIEVIVLEVSGNQTISSLFFQTQ